MYRRPGEIRKANARKRLIKPLLDTWTHEDEHFSLSVNDYASTAVRRLSKNWRKSAPKAGWDKADKEEFYMARLKLKEEHVRLDMEEWKKWDEYARQEEEERIRQEEYYFEYDPYEGDYYGYDDDPYNKHGQDDWSDDLDDSRYWGDYDDCPCPSCQGIDDPYYDSLAKTLLPVADKIKLSQMERMWAEKRVSEAAEEDANWEMDAEELDEYEYQRRL
jgi:hypothetical protein